MLETFSHSPEETRAFAKQVATQLRGGDVVILVGDLGTGKTTFVQGLAKAFGVKEAVRSPTFTVMNIHPAKHPEVNELIHIDFYRMKDQKEILSLGLEEWIGKKDVIIFAEWGRGFLDAVATARVSFEMPDSTTARHIQFDRIEARA